MDSKRQQKVSRLIQKEMGELFQRDTKGIFGGAFITVTHVKISPDLGVASIYLSFLKNNNQNAILQNIRENTKQVRKMLGEKVGKQLRIVPQLVFHIDDTVEYAANIDKILSGLDIPPAKNEDEENEDE
ncbi:ribosome-binding factor A [Sporocytophaga myxococcoides]|uniref:Ribosome-binding factor A n=1 Tax=Sporocytophaga myxococcoides TaxID=153721 RepID=A0A098LJP3_9BACT|nr:30S ribosome-binding factor RbfA [Sporocytophaga myxococcoides]GAL87195.1 ribosome-binding factor A [Sporocytophaga myxococcoides]